MKERISRLANGLVEYESPDLMFSHQIISQTIVTGGIVKGEFQIASEKGVSVKGLAYSTNVRVRVLNHAFGGTNIRIRYEVKSQYLEQGDKVEGVFWLITNSGEFKIPFSFEVELEGSVKKMWDLQTPENFAELAFENSDAALRLFEYSEFTKAPFMQDLTIRTIYDTIHGKGRREHALEEFLIGIVVKDQVELSILKRDWIIGYEEEHTETLLIEKNTWGYIKAEIVCADSFIELGQKTLYGEDFNGNSYELPFTIKPEQLHGGRNYGIIYIKTGMQTIPIRILAMGSKEGRTRFVQYRDYKYSIKRYVELRLDYECGHFQEELLLGKMQTELEHLLTLRDSDLTALLLTEVFLLRGNRAQASSLLDQYRDSILENRMVELELYCFYQYLYLKTMGEDEAVTSLIRLLHKYNDENPRRYHLLLLILKLDKELLEDKSIVLGRLQEKYQEGSNSPFLYTEACKVLDSEPELLRSMDSFTLQVLSFGAKRNLIGQELALQIAMLCALERGCQKIYLSLLERLYKIYPNKQILEGICGLLMKGNHRTEKSFQWFCEGVKKELRLTRLYEYYIYTLPKDFNELLPMEILLYFSYPHSLDYTSRERLYCNLLKFADNQMPIYSSYMRQIEEFTMTCLFEGRINSSMANIYHHIIYKDLIDEKIAKVFPEILRSYRVECKQPFIKQVVVCYEELKEKLVIPLHDGVAYVPMYVEDCLLLFQDGYGSCYMEADYKISRLMKEPELEERCFELCPDHIMLRLRRCKEMIRNSQLTEEEVVVAEEVLKRNILHEIYGRNLTSMLIAYYSQSESESEHELLISIDKTILSREDRILSIEALIQQGYIKNAYKMIQTYGFESVKINRLMKLCSKMILEQLFDEDELLLHLSFHVFQSGLFDNVTLDYLCEYFNGTCSKMYQILIQAVADHVETYNLEERLLGQMLFINDNEHMDQVFHLYIVRKTVKESIVRAFLTMKCYNCFLSKEDYSLEIFEYIEAMVQRSTNLEKVPVIWKLALSHYYSKQETWTGMQKDLCQDLVDTLLELGFIFEYMQKFKSFIVLPEDIRDQVILQCYGEKSQNLRIQMRTMPEEEWHIEGMRHMYEGIFIKQILLFDGEVLEYEIYEESDDRKKIIDSGQIKNKRVDRIEQEDRFDNRYSFLNAIALYIELEDEATLNDRMSEYMITDKIVSKLFD